MDAFNSEGGNSEAELDLLRQEYFFLQSTIEDYNKQIWVIKALGITGTGTVAALVIQQKQPLIALMGCMIPLYFWLLESQWKHFQRGFYPRIAAIEDILQREYRFRGPAIFGDWCCAFERPAIAKRKGYVWDGLLNPSVFISYMLEIAFLVLLYFINFPKS
jgi:hypothetical protein